MPYAPPVILMIPFSTSSWYFWILDININILVSSTFHLRFSLNLAKFMMDLLAPQVCYHFEINKFCNKSCNDQYTGKYYIYVYLISSVRTCSFHRHAPLCGVQTAGCNWPSKVGLWIARTRPNQYRTQLMDTSHCHRKDLRADSARSWTYIAPVGCQTYPCWPYSFVTELHYGRWFDFQAHVLCRIFRNIVLACLFGAGIMPPAFSPVADRGFFPGTRAPGTWSWSVTSTNILRQYLDHFIHFPVHLHGVVLSYSEGQLCPPHPTPPKWMSTVQSSTDALRISLTSCAGEWHWNLCSRFTVTLALQPINC